MERNITVLSISERMKIWPQSLINERFQHKFKNKTQAVCKLSRNQSELKVGSYDLY